MLKFYKKFISPLLVIMFGHACRFTPTCSEYMDDAVVKYGVWKGSVMGLRRILRCNPLTQPRFDPVK